MFGFCPAGSTSNERDSRELSMFDGTSTFSCETPPIKVYYLESFKITQLGDASETTSSRILDKTDLDALRVPEIGFQRFALTAERSLMHDSRFSEYSKDCSSG